MPDAVQHSDHSVAGPDISIVQPMEELRRCGPKLAVVISCYNYSEYVRLAIESVQRQGRSDCEVVVIDDGSTDGSWEVIESCGVKAYRIENGGQRGACLYGVQQTTAPFVMFLDADDELLPGSLDTIIGNLDSGVAKLQFPLLRVQDGQVISGPVPPLEDDRGRDLTRRVLKSGVYPSPPTSGNVFRRDVCDLLETAGYDNAVDGVILFAAPFMGDVVTLSQELGVYRVHSRNKSGLGKLLDPRTFQRDLQRFLSRMHHLRQVLELYGLAEELIPPENTYFYLERSLYLAVASGTRVPLTNLARLLIRLWSDEHPINTKLKMTPFFLLLVLLPRERARRGLAYRLKACTRSTAGLIRAVL